MYSVYYILMPSNTKNIHNYRYVIYSHGDNETRAVNPDLLVHPAATGQYVNGSICQWVNMSVGQWVNGSLCQYVNRSIG